MSAASCLSVTKGAHTSLLRRRRILGVHVNSYSYVKPPPHMPHTAANHLANHLGLLNRLTQSLPVGFQVQIPD